MDGLFGTEAAFSLLFAAGNQIHAWQRESGSNDSAGTVELIVERSSDSTAALMPQFSPDGRWFVYMSNDSGLAEI